MKHSTDLHPALAPVFATALQEKRLVGCVATVSHRGEIIYQQAHGMADRESQQPMAEGTLFRLASVTKPIVTLAALRLADKGILDLQASVTRWLPDFRPELANGVQPEITIHHLLTHTAGLAYGFNQPDYIQQGISDGIDRVDFDLYENLRRIAAAPLLYEPGKGWNYSLAMDVLGAVMEQATGQSLATVIEEEVSRPLQLKGLGFVAAQEMNLATPYANASPEPVRMTENMNVLFPDGGNAVRFSPSRVFAADAFASGGAGMFGCSDDVFQVLETFRTNHNNFLSPQLYQTLFKNYAVPSAAVGDPGWGFGYGGAFLFDPLQSGTPQSEGTLQWGGVYGHNWFIDPTQELTVLLLTNTAYEGMIGRLTLDIRNSVYQLLA
ncbi:serine hydrolase domain-containing protein [Vibrio mangrovi]|uniref:Esterase EstB n=1 Tax=Vibrio mangrovi TaxID=474394 RepID=A0A1Y6IYF6_9VIBR|nr:serine hydrolase domain-containing protein [Vibrio mangrovi]MDW6002416.1 serine hydrolase domain-containing protein [Vibrio mangrovi]SMS02687.1 Esterase EstB [Vibrio mangrovi]